MQDGKDYGVNPIPAQEMYKEWTLLYIQIALYTKALIILLGTIARFSVYR